MDKKTFLTDDELIASYNKIYEDGMMWLLLGSLVSSENFWEINENTTEKQYKELTERYKDNISGLENIIKVINCCDKIPESDQKKIEGMAVDEAVLLNDELNSVNDKWREISGNKKQAITLRQKKYWLEHYHDEKYEAIQENILKSFKDLVFDEIPHKYYLNGVELDCVSNITHLFKPHFDTDSMAQATYERNYDNENSKYYRMTVEQIKESWKKTSDDACELGSARHNFGESVFWWMVGEYDKIVPEFVDRFTIDENGERICTPKFPKEEAIVRFWNDLPECYIPILAENKVFNVNENYAYSGTFDILFYYDAPLNGKPDSQSGAQVFDYKTNRDLYKNFKEQKLLSPFDELLDMPLSIYKLQLAAYQLCLEKINIPIIARCLIWLKPNGEYEKVRLEDLSKQLNKALINKFKK